MERLDEMEPVATYQDLTYGYDPKVNITSIQDQVNGITHSYGYDVLDRLQTAGGAGSNPYSQSYEYDRIGNITYKSDVGSYTYDYGSKPHAVRAAGNVTLRYDGIGNMIQRSIAGGVTLNISYNSKNKPALIKRDYVDYVAFTYDGSGKRVKKENLSTGQVTLYFGDAYEQRGDVGIIHLFAGSMRIASIRSDGKDQYYHPNHLGSASVITDGNGDIKERIEYFPFGTYRQSTDFDAQFPDVNYTFTDQEDDDELGLYNYKARLYDPVLGRFISPDSKVPDPSDLQALNRYTYCFNNPLIYTDPSGEVAGGDDLIIAFVVAVVYAAFIGAAQAGPDGNMLQGAAIGAAIGAASFGAGYGVGFVVSGGSGVKPKLLT